MTPVQRYEELARDLEFSTRIFSAVFDRQAEIEKITYMMGIVGRIPQAAQVLKWQNVLGKLMESFGWDREEMIQEPQAAPPGQAEGPYGSLSDGGQGVKTGAQPANPIEGASAGFLAGSTGAPPAGMSELMPGVRRSGNPR